LAKLEAKIERFHFFSGHDVDYVVKARIFYIISYLYHEEKWRLDDAR